MTMHHGRPAPPAWKILLYSVLSLLALLALGWFNTHVLGDHTQYPPRSQDISQSSEAPVSQ
ncbi:MAG: hypothetical protein HFG26_04990 [Provencibacterium sp.]|jgi:hypothetical protein|nr:hypothetical protein [Provencibacterium sp.]